MVLLTCFFLYKIYFNLTSPPPAEARPQMEKAAAPTSGEKSEREAPWLRGACLPSSDCSPLCPWLLLQPNSSEKNEGPDREYL